MFEFENPMMNLKFHSGIRVITLHLLRQFFFQPYPPPWTALGDPVFELAGENLHKCFFAFLK